MSETESTPAQTVSLAQPEIRVYQCSKGHQIQSRYPFTITLTLGTGIPDNDIVVTTGALCPLCFRDALDQNLGMNVVGGIGLLGS